MSEEKKKNVQPAEAEKPSQDSSKSLEVASKEATVASDNKEAAKPVEKLITIPQVDEDTKKMLAKAGFSWDSFVQAFNKVNNFAESVEARFGAISKNLEEAPQKVVEALKAEAVKRQTEMAKEIQEKGGGEEKKGGGGGLKDLASLASLLGSGGGGGGMDEEMLKLTKEMMHMNIDRMRQDMGFTDAIKNAIVTKIASKAVTEII